MSFAYPGTEAASGVFSFVVGAGLTWGLAKASRILPNRRAWHLTDSSRLVVCVAASAATDTGEYVRPATGIGQVRALAVILPSLNRGYRELDVDHINLSSEALHRGRDHDLICLGGVKNNRITAELLDTLSDYVPLAMQGSTIIWDGEEFIGEVGDGVVAKDYGFIIQTRNPFAYRERRCVILAGSHTYGTIAAARHFVNKYGRLRVWNLNSFAALVCADVRDEYVCPAEEIRFARIPSGRQAT